MASYKNTGIGFKSNGAIQSTDRPDRLSLKKFIATQHQRGRMLINDYLKALQMAENSEKPNREMLYKLYHNIVGDADLTSEWETRRKLRIIGSGFGLFDASNKPNEEATKLLNKKWFYEFLSLAFDSKLYGHSLIEVKSLNSDGTIAAVELVPRRHVIPEKGLFILKIGDEKGILYREDLTVKEWLFEFGANDDLGILAKAAPYILFLRFALSAWSEYAEKFVMPTRIGKTNTKDTESLNRMDEMLLNMATASYAVLDKDETFEFIETSKTDGSSVFDKLMITCAAKLAKLLNGASIGEASQGGSLAKENVGLNIQELVTKADMIWFESIMNDDILPRLTAMGYPFQDLVFKFNRPENLAELWKLYEGILKYYDIEEAEITDKFNVPVKKKEAASQTTSLNANALSKSFFR